MFLEAFLISYLCGIDDRQNEEEKDAISFLFPLVRTMLEWSPEGEEGQSTISLPLLSRSFHVKQLLSIALGAYCTVLLFLSMKHTH